MDKRAYRKEIWKDSISKARKKYDTRADTMKVVFGVLFATLLIIILVGLGIWNKNASIPFFMWGLFGADILTILATIFSIPIMASLDMWNVAANKNGEQKNEIKKLRKNISELEERFSSKKIKFIDPGSKLYSKRMRFLLF